MRSLSQLAFVGTTSLLCLLLVGFLLHTAALQFDNPRLVTVHSFEPHFQLGHDEKDAAKWPYLEFKSSPLRPPLLNITGKASANAGKYLFMTPKGPHRESGKPAIYTLEGDPVFSDETHGHTSDFKPQTFRNEKYLTFSYGYSTGAPNPGHGYGKAVFLDHEYQPIEFDLNDTITSLIGNQPGNMDFHEHIMTSSDTLFVTAYNNTPHDLSPIGGPKDGWLANSMFFEIEPPTGRVVSSWSAVDHILLSDSRLPLPSYMGDGTKRAPYDHFHMNSIQPLGDDRLLINSRHTWCSYVLDRASGKVLQTIDGYEHGFRWAHHARAHNLTDDGDFTMTLFDNHNMKDDMGGHFTQGLLFQVSQKDDSAKLLQTFETDFYADSQGSLQALENGIFLLGGGSVPMFIEYDAAGHLVWQARFEAEERGYSYRTFRGDWSGTPKDWDPSLVVEGSTAYVSWNGATDVETWNVYVNESLRGTVKRAGFETMVRLERLEDQDCVSMAAVQDGEEVRMSNTVC
ncbi:hypothetical protein Q7P35_009559 [Cladosporium inversicolor]